MHNRKPRRKRKFKPPNEEKPAEEKRKDRNESTEKKQAPSNKRRKKRIQQDNQTQPTTDDVVPHDEVYTIDDIISHRYNTLSRTHEVLVAWDGYDSTHNSSEPVSLIRETAEQTLLDYAKQHNLGHSAGWQWMSRSMPHNREEQSPTDASTKTRKSSTER